MYHKAMTVIIPTWHSYGSTGAAFTRTATGMRTSYKNRFGAHGVYHRYGTDQHFDPPYKFSFGLVVRARKDPYRFEPELGGTLAGYDPGIVIHPLHGMAHTPAHANKENTFFVFGGRRSEYVSAAAEIDGAYQYRTGLLRRERGANFDPVGKGRMEIECVVNSHQHYLLYVDGVQMVEVIEDLPATMSGSVGIGLRLDFFDAEVDNFRVTRQPPEPIIKKDLLMNTYLPEHERIIDTRTAGKIIQAGEVRKIKLGDHPGLDIAALNVTALSGGRSGWLSIGGTPSASPGTSALNYDPDGIANASLVGGFPDGHVYVKAHSGACHVIVDLQAWG